MQKHTLITLIDLVQRPNQLIDRLIKLAEALYGTEFVLSIGHVDRNSSADIRLKNQLRYLDHVLLTSIKPNGNKVELARMRNAAVGAVESSIILLIDVDIYPDLKLFRILVSNIENGNRISMAPCIYLTSPGTRLVEKGSADLVVESALAFSPRNVMHWALPSSLMALRVEDFKAIGGFCELYRGHGYEDFDFILRLSLHTKLIEPSLDLMIDKTYQAPLLSIGFRAALARLCLANLLNGNIAFHLFHKKNNKCLYHEQREVNSILFQTRLKNLLSRNLNTINTNNNQELIFDFFTECAKFSIDPSKYYALFDARPRYLLKPRSKWKRLKNLFDF